MAISWGILRQIQSSLPRAFEPNMPRHAPTRGLDQRLNYGKRRLVELKSGGGMGEERLEAKNVHRPMPPCNPSPFCIVSPRTALMVPAPYIFVGEATCTWHEETRHLGSGFCVAIGQFWIPSFPVERSPNSDQSSKAIGDMLPVKCARFSWNDRRNRDKENTRETRET